MTKAKKDKLKADLQTRKGSKIKLHDFFSAKVKARCKTTIQRKDGRP